MLTDLDELVTKCPDPRSRKYISESVKCYKTGAYRSAIVSCWIAVVFDLVDKIREISASGDQAASALINKFDEARRKHDISESLKFEKELLPNSKDKFEFLSPIEYTDLQRLLEDRNRCAHPSLVSDTEVFEPTAELARVHIVNSINYVLSQPAAQGKAALDRVLEDLNSRFFPTKTSDVEVFLRGGPLANPRSALIRNFINILLKNILKKTDNDKEISSRSKKAFFSLRKIHPHYWNDIVPTALNSILSSIRDDPSLCKVGIFLGVNEGTSLWPHVSESEKLKLLTFIKSYPSNQFDDVEYFFLKEKSPLREAANFRIKNATEDEILDSYWLDIPDIVIERLIHLYGTKNNFAQANDFAKRIKEHLLNSKEASKHFNLLIEAARKNSQVRDSNQFTLLIKLFIEKKEINKEYANERLNDIGADPIG
jgi:hypothetical protein